MQEQRKIFVSLLLFWNTQTKITNLEISRTVLRASAMPEEHHSWLAMCNDKLEIKRKILYPE